MIFTFEQIRKYFEVRLDRSMPARDKVAVLCPFHDDRSPSATVFLTGNGGFNCNGCQAKGNVLQFEMRRSNCDITTARQNVARITGADAAQSSVIGLCCACYDFRRADGSIAFQKRRYEAEDGKKTFRIYRPDGRGWKDGLSDDTPRVLFNFPDVITANLVLIAEGEKDCETLSQVIPWPERPGLRIATTTNFEGAWQPGQAPKWLPHYSQVFAGKTVIVFEDNDEAGRAWADHVCLSIAPYADKVRRVTFRDMAAKSDVSDWMEDHSVEDLRRLISSAPLWAASEKTTEVRRVFADFCSFVSSTPPEIDWLVDGVIERGANGFIAGEPKGSKSFCAADLAIALASGTPWLDFPVPHAVRVGLVSREDNPALTGWRLGHLMQGRGLNAEQAGALGQNLYVNTRAQTTTLMVDNEAEMEELTSAVKRLQLELVILDVFNILHTADENDNTQMAQVLRRVKRLQAETGAAVAILHHFSKDEHRGRITQRLRGASAIAGFAEWMIGLAMVDEDTRTRRMEFESKTSSPPQPIYYTIDAQEGKPARILRCDGSKPERKTPAILRTWHDREN